MLMDVTRAQGKNELFFLNSFFLRRNLSIFLILFRSPGSNTLITLSFKAARTLFRGPGPNGMSDFTCASICRSFFIGPGPNNGYNKMSLLQLQLITFYIFYYLNEIV
jgi:hypothetical protein